MTDTTAMNLVRRETIKHQVANTRSRWVPPYEIARRVAVESRGAYDYDRGKISQVIEYEFADGSLIWEDNSGGLHTPEDYLADLGEMS